MYARFHCAKREELWWCSSTSIWQSLEGVRGGIVKQAASIISPPLSLTHHSALVCPFMRPTLHCLPRPQRSLNTAQIVSWHASFSPVRYLEKEDPVPNAWLARSIRVELLFQMFVWNVLLVHGSHMQKQRSIDRLVGRSVGRSRTWTWINAYQSRVLLLRPRLMVVIIAAESRPEMLLFLRERASEQKRNIFFHYNNQICVRDWHEQRRKKGSWE